MIPALTTLLSIVASQSFQRFFRCASFFFITISFISCDSSKGSNAKDNTDSITIIRLPVPDSLAPEEKLRLNTACRQWYDSMLRNTGFNGGILVAKKGNIVFEQYKGEAHIGGKDTITATTPFHIASVSKTFTAMAVLKLWEQGKLDIDDAFNKYFPAFNYPAVTIRTLLDHRSGLPNYSYFMEDLGWDKKVYIKNQDVLDYLITRKTEIPDIATPNTRFNYCNTNYVLLALLVEKVTGEPFPKFIKKTFFDPLQMTHSFVFTLADVSHVNPSYDWRGGLIPLNYLDEVYGDKNIFTTAEDLLLWDRALSSNLLFKKETLDQAFAPYSNERPGIKNYGLGWHLNIYPNGKRIVFHNGWWHGYNAVFIRLIEDDATIILTGNRYTRTIYKAKQLANIFSNYFQVDIEEENENALTQAGDSTNKKIVRQKMVRTIHKRTTSHKRQR